MASANQRIADEVEVFEDNYTPLHSATESLDLPTLRSLLSSNRWPINSRTKSSFETPLFYAVNSSYSDTTNAVAAIQLLASHGADLNPHNLVGATPLHDAAEYGYFEAAKQLIELGADINIDNMEPVKEEHADGCGCGNQHALQGLLGTLTGGAFKSGKFEEYVTPLHRAAGRGHVDILKLLLEKGARIDAMDNDRGTPLHCAAGSGHVEACKVLLDWEGGKVCLGVKEKYGYLPIHAAADYNKNVEVVRSLLEHGSQVDIPVDGNRKWQKGLTPLALACENADKEGKAEIVKVLLEYGADPNYLAERRQTPFLLAVLSGNVKVAQMLLEKGADLKSLAAPESETPPLHLAATKGHAQMCKFLVKKAGCNVRSKSEDGYTPLHNAAGYSKRKDAIATLVPLGAEVEAKIPDGRTPLHMACFKGQLECVQELLCQGADIEAQDDSGWTPLHFAANYGHLDVLKYLLKPLTGIVGAQVGKRTTGGPGWNMDDCTAADLATLKGHEAVVQVLVGAGDTVSKSEE